MNLATLCRRINIKELVTSVPLYNGLSGKPIILFSMVFVLMAYSIGCSHLRVLMAMHFRCIGRWSELDVQTLGNKKDSWVH